MICYPGKVSLTSYLLTIISLLFLFLPNCNFNYIGQSGYILILALTIYFAVANLLLRLKFKGEIYQVAVRAVFLGYVFGLGVLTKVYGSELWQIFGVYMCIMSFFHFSEYLSMAIIQPNLVGVDSYVINHSKEYTIAAIMSWLEFLLESYFFPGIKSCMWLSYIGLIVSICGEFLRKSAMLTAKSNFNHIVQCEKHPDHVLVTTGIYSIFRHPSYVGWFYWSIGTQIILLNPFCSLAYTYVSWRFFNERIQNEEITLLNFFGQQYLEYQERVSTGLPFIDGYRIKPM